MNIQIEHESKVFLYHINIFYTTACENRPHSSEIASAKKKTKMNAGRKNLLSNSTHGMEQLQSSHLYQTSNVHNPPLCQSTISDQKTLVPKYLRLQTVVYQSVGQEMIKRMRVQNIISRDIMSTSIHQALIQGVSFISKRVQLYLLTLRHREIISNPIRRLP